MFLLLPEKLPYTGTSPLEKLRRNSLHLFCVKDVNVAEKFFRKTILNAARCHIPAGRQCFSTPNLTAKNKKKLAQERDDMRLENPSNPTLKNLNQF